MELKDIRKPEKNKKEKKQRKYSRRELAELMDTNKSTYKRVNGAIRRR